MFKGRRVNVESYIIIVMFRHSWTHSVFMVKAHREHLLQTPSYTPAVHVMHVHLYPKDAEEEEDGKNGATDR